MPQTPSPRSVQIGGSWKVVRGNQILDSFNFHADNPNAQDAQNLIGSLTAKIAAESWTPEDNTNLISVDIFLHGFRDVTPLEHQSIVEWDQSQTTEYQQYLKLKEKFG